MDRDDPELEWPPWGLIVRHWGPPAAARVFLGAFAGVMGCAFLGVGLCVAVVGLIFAAIFARSLHTPLPLVLGGSLALVLLPSTPVMIFAWRQLEQARAKPYREAQVWTFDRRDGLLRVVDQLRDRRTGAVTWQTAATYPWPPAGAAHVVTNTSAEHACSYTLFLGTGPTALSGTEFPSREDLEAKADHINRFLTS